jgi:two-component system response regulator PrrA
MRVLVIDGRQGPSDEIAQKLVAAGHEVIRSPQRERAKETIFAYEPQVVVVVALPFQDWHPELLSELQGWEHTPYSVAVAAPEPPDLIALLESGADACCAYPLAAGFLEAQVLAVGRRASVARAEQPIPEIVTIRELTVDNARYQVAFAGTRLALTPAEFRILASLARRPGRVVPTETLSTEALGSAPGPRQAKDVLRVHVRRIRNKIHEAGGSSDYIWNIRGVGYMLERRAASGRGGGIDPEQGDNGIDDEDEEETVS